MDFSRIQLSEDAQEFWRREIIPFFDEMLPEAVLADERAAGNGYIPEYELALGRRGWQRPTAPPNAGGAGLDPQCAALVLGEEARRAGPMFPVKGSHNLVMNVINLFGSAELKADLNAADAAGTVKCCLGYTEPDCGSDAAAITTRAVRDGDGWLISGQKMFSTGAHLAQYVMITARTNPAAPSSRGITLFLLPLAQDGVECHAIRTLGGERTNVIYLDATRVPDSHRLGPVDEGWRVASGALAAEHGMGHSDSGGQAEPDPEIVAALGGPSNWQGVLQRTFDAVVAWLRTAQTEDGTALIVDPHIRGRLAQILIDIAVIDVTPQPFARVIASDLLIRDAADLLDMCGAAGLLCAGATGTAAAGLVEWTHRFAQGTSIYGGTTDIQRNIIAQHVLGLPRPR